jgi:hypothetical protein
MLAPFEGNKACFFPVTPPCLNLETPHYLLGLQHLGGTARCVLPFMGACEGTLLSA